MYKLMALVCSLFCSLLPREAMPKGLTRLQAIPLAATVLILPLPVFHRLLPKHSLIGWNGSLEAKVLPFLGIVGDLSGHYGNETVGSLLFCRVPSVPCTENENVSSYTFTAGPQVSLHWDSLSLMPMRFLAPLFIAS